MQINDKNSLLIRSDFFDQSEIHFVLLDKDLTIIDVNATLLAYYKLERSALIGKNYIDVSPSPDKEKLAAVFKEVICTGIPRVLEQVSSDNKFGKQYNRVKAFKVQDGLGITASNITQLKKSLEALEVFSYKLSHDVKSPVNSILGLTELILNGTADHENILQYCKLIQQQAQHLDVNITELLETMRSEDFERHFEEINFYRLIDEVKRSVLFNDGFSEVDFEEEIHFKKSFFSSRVILDSVFQNLVENAIKYRDKKKIHKVVRISIQEENDCLKITIEDNGIGIPKDRVQDIFKAFFRANDHVTGTGLGLYTVKYSIEKLNGSIKVESQENEGTTFTIFFPFQKP